MKSLAGFTHKLSHCAAVGFVGPVVVWDLLLGRGSICSWLCSTPKLMVIYSASYGWK